MSYPLMIFLMVAGLSLLALGSHAFIQGARQIARLCGVPPLIIGIVLVGLGTSFPEWVVSLLAALKGSSAISMGNAIGSNITNMGLVIGLTALILPLQVAKRVMRFDIPIYVLVSVVVGVMLCLGRLTRGEGLFLLLLFFSYLFFLFRRSMHAKKNEELMTVALPKGVSRKKQIWQALMLWFFGLVVVLISADWLVTGAVGLARAFHLNELIIGLTVVAIGTTLPELAATMVSAFHQEHDIAVGNIIGSNIFNLLAVLAMPAIFAPGRIPPHLFARDYMVMLFFGVMLIVIICLPKRYQISRWSGLLMLTMFVAYIVYLVTQLL